LVGAKSAKGGIDAVNIIKPDLVRGTVQVIGAMPILVYQKYIEKDVRDSRGSPNTCNGWTSNAVIWEELYWDFSFKITHLLPKEVLASEGSWLCFGPYFNAVH